MVNSFCYNGCGEPAQDNLKTRISDKIIIGSVVLLTFIVFGAIYCMNFF